MCACVYLHIEIWKYRCEHVQNNQLIHEHTHPTVYQSSHWMIGRHVDIIHVRLYLWICIWIYVPTCRNKCKWCTMKHLVLARIKGLKKSPKIPGNTFSDVMLKSRFQNCARFFLAGVMENLQLFFARSTFNYCFPGTLVAGRDVSLRYICVKRDCCTFCVVWSQTDCCAVVNLLQ